MMWVGNVPGDATTEELEAFFQRVPPAASEDRASTEVGSSVPSPRSHASTFSETERRKIEDERGADVASVFLISRSNCAFVNYASEEALNRGVERCNGKPLRPLEVGDCFYPGGFLPLKRGGLWWVADWTLANRWIHDARNSSAGFVKRATT